MLRFGLCFALVSLQLLIEKLPVWLSPLVLNSANLGSAVREPKKQTVGLEDA